ncbi:MAG: type IX secretion system membrane protein PorP/SprF, partial [Saprospiraceae bacterium]|nr:type IX secretion system membrane protein PorP/SprF [Saprospiraceae bacterium]
LGFSITNDKVGSTGSTQLNGMYAYRIPFGEGKLAIGMQASVMNWRSDWEDLNYRDPASQDEVFQNYGFSRWLPNFGAGIYYSTDKYYLGFSVPRLMALDLRRSDDITTEEWAKVYRHYYFTAGAAFPIRGDAIVLKPSLLIKSIGLFEEFTASIKDPVRVGAPAEFDVDVSLLFYHALWVGASFRSAFAAQQFGGLSSFDSGDLWASYYLRNGFRVGLSYDYTLSGLRNFSKGTYELMLGYDFSYRTKRFNTPRYF